MIKLETKINRMLNLWEILYLMMKLITEIKMMKIIHKSLREKLIIIWMQVLIIDK